MSCQRDHNTPPPHASSTTETTTRSDWLNSHWDACRPEYEAMLRSVGLEAGWAVLDAGCGSGAHLPLLAELVGPSGRLAAIDLAASNIEVVEAYLAHANLPCEVTTHTGTLQKLPYGDATFDALWCANVTQYFEDAALLEVLAEFRRVVRPGGTVAIKDVDMQLMRVSPADPFLVAHHVEASLRSSDAGADARGAVRGRELRRWLERAGLVEVWQKTTLIERWSPLRPVERHFFAQWLAFLAELAMKRPVPEADVPFWRALLNPDTGDHLVDHPEFYVCEGQVVAVGRVPQ